MSQPFRLLMTGSRTWHDVRVIEQALAVILDRHPEGVLLVHGACPPRSRRHRRRVCARTPGTAPSRIPPTGTGRASCRVPFAAVGVLVARRWPGNGKCPSGNSHRRMAMRREAFRDRYGRQGYGLRSASNWLRRRGLAGYARDDLGRRSRQAPARGRTMLTPVRPGVSCAVRGWDRLVQAVMVR
jgi:YspA, cpYpsA-related SLOG family